LNFIVLSYISAVNSHLSLSNNTELHLNMKTYYFLHYVNRQCNNCHSLFECQWTWKTKCLHSNN